MTPRTAVPCRGQIIEFAEDSGTIATEHATRVRFGRTSCSGFEPRVGLEVWVMATRVLPVVGERATLVNLTGASESADPAERARQAYEAKERALQARHAAVESSRAHVRALLEGLALPLTWRPGFETLAEVIALPLALRVLQRLDERAGEVMRARASRHDAARASLGVDLVVEAHRDAQVTPELRIGPCAPWPGQDACLVPFAQIDGDEPDLYAVYFHPDVHRLRGALPVVVWRHDDALGFVAESAEVFVAALAHGRLHHEGVAVAARPDLAAATSLRDPGVRLDVADRLPADLAAIIDARGEERQATSALGELAGSTDHGAVLAASEALERIYRDLRWPYHERHAQFQRRQLFEA